LSEPVFSALSFPFEDGPEEEAVKKGGRRHRPAFDGAVPEGVTEVIGQGADDAGAHDGEKLLGNRAGQAGGACAEYQ